MESRELINIERANGTLYYVGDEACGCALYRVTVGRVSQYMRSDDSVVMHNVGCDDAEETKSTIEWFGNR